MINEFIREDYKNPFDIYTLDNYTIKESAYMKNGIVIYRSYRLDNNSKTILLHQIKGVNRKNINEYWFGSEEAITTDYLLLMDAIQNSEGNKKEQLQALLNRLTSEYKQLPY